MRYGRPRWVVVSDMIDPVGCPMAEIRTAT
jgi:hypothetical protein